MVQLAEKVRARLVGHHNETNDQFHDLHDKHSSGSEVKWLVLRSRRRARVAHQQDETDHLRHEQKEGRVLDADGLGILRILCGRTFFGLSHPPPTRDNLVGMRDSLARRSLLGSGRGVFRARGNEDPVATATISGWMCMVTATAQIIIMAHAVVILRRAIMSISTHRFEKSPLSQVMFVLASLAT